MFFFFVAFDDENRIAETKTIEDVMSLKCVDEEGLYDEVRIVGTKTIEVVKSLDQFCCRGRVVKRFEADRAR